MARPDLQPVLVLRKRLQALPQRPRPHLHRPLDVGGAFEQVGTADVADEHEVAGDGGNRQVGGGAVGDQERQVLGRVAGRVQHVDADVANLQVIAVVQEAAFRREGVLPVGIAFVGEIQRAAGLVRELARARHVVGVDVGFGDVRDPQAFVRGGLDVLVDVAVGVDDNGLAVGLAADQVAGLRNRRFEEALDEHGGRRGLTPRRLLNAATRGQTPMLPASGLRCTRVFRRTEMPRRRRITPVGQPHHVVNRSQDGRQLFAEDADYQRFIHLMTEGRRRYAVEIYAVLRHLQPLSLAHCTEGAAGNFCVHPMGHRSSWLRCQVRQPDPREGPRLSASVLVGSDRNRTQPFPQRAAIHRGQPGPGAPGRGG